MKKIHYSLILVILIASCSNKFTNKTISVGNKSSVDCSNYKVTKLSPNSDSVRLSVNFKSCSDDYLIPGAIMVIDINQQRQKFQADINGHVNISLPKGKYSIQALAINFKPMQIPIANYELGSYEVHFDVRYDDPLIN